MKNRHLDNALKEHFAKYREVLILLGSRQIGKTTLVNRIYPEALYLNVDLDPTRNMLDTYDLPTYQRLINPTTQTVIVDEVQRLKDPGRAIKILYDNIPNHQYVVTGSSAFHIKNKMSESLAGRKISYELFPLTLSEFLVQQHIEPPELNLELFATIIGGRLPANIVKSYDTHSLLDQILIYGLYPAMLDHPHNSHYLQSLVDSTIFRDLDQLTLLENRSAAISLLKLLAHQIGSLVNYAELGLRLGIDAKTVKRYIALFEQSFIIFSLSPYSTNARDEIGKMPKIYFHDLGLRNALIDNFTPMTTRADAGQLFENFIISELYKYNKYGDFGYHFNFWRTTSGSEVDLVLSKSDGTLLAVEIKHQSRRVNRSFVSRYPQAQMSVISRDNYWV